jgi:acyl-CoA synthetase (AMP-forming)/AMP-acid ligase II
MHQEILHHAKRAHGILERQPLRFIRSSSAPLAPKLMAEMEMVFRTPVIEAYGMTEAAHQITTNPLPPRNRKPGSVGLPAGSEVAIVDDEGTLLPNGAVGQVVVRGRNVTERYENDTAASAVTFRNGWCRTGDQGLLDAEGFLFLTGRLKEIINRGGEKVTPPEIEEVLMNHPGVHQAVAFAVSHPTLGQDIAAAVAPHEGAVLTEDEVREFALRRLPGFKVPTRIIILDEIPRGPTGKLQRIGLADRLADRLAVKYEPPSDGLEQLSATMFEHILQRPCVGRNDNFFAMGGDSIRAMQVVVRLSRSLGIEIPPTILFHCPTAAALAAGLSRLQREQDIATLAVELQKLPPDEAARMLEQAFGGDA